MKRSKLQAALRGENITEFKETSEALRNVYADIIVYTDPNERGGRGKFRVKPLPGQGVNPEFNVAFPNIHRDRPNERFRCDLIDMGTHYKADIMSIERVHPTTKPEKPIASPDNVKLDVPSIHSTKRRGVL